MVCPFSVRYRLYSYITYLCIMTYHVCPDGCRGDVPEHVLLCYEALAEAVSASGDRTGAHRVYEEGAAATMPYINAR